MCSLLFQVLAIEQEEENRPKKNSLPSWSFHSRGLRQGQDQARQMRHQGAKFKEVPTIRVMYNLALA